MQSRSEFERTPNATRLEKVLQLSAFEAAIMLHFLEKKGAILRQTIGYVGLLIVVLVSIGQAADTTQPVNRAKVWLGIQMLNLNEVRRLNPTLDGTPISLPNVKGVYILNAFDKGSAKTAGLAQGDIITNINGEPTPDAADVRAWVLAKAEVGKRYTVTFFRSPAINKWESREITMVGLAPDESGKRAADAYLDIEKQIAQRGRAALASAPVGFVLNNKTVHDVDPERKLGFDTIMLDYSCRNNSDKPIRSFAGTLVFRNLFDHEILRVEMTCTAETETKVFVKGEEYKQTQALRFDESNESQQIVATTGLDDMKDSFEVKEVLFSDGTKLAVQPAQAVQEKITEPAHTPGERYYRDSKGNLISETETEQRLQHLRSKIDAMPDNADKAFMQGTLEAMSDEWKRVKSQGPVKP